MDSIVFYERVRCGQSSADDFSELSVQDMKIFVSSFKIINIITWNPNVKFIPYNFEMNIIA